MTRHRTRVDGGDHTTVVFTDLDGTLLDRETYQFRDALPALDLLRARGVPLVMCSSKTRAEQMDLRSRLCLHDPFIVEDGSAVYVERDYFPFKIAGDPADDSLLVIRLCPVYADVRRAVREVAAETGVSLTGYGDLDADEIARRTGLDREAAARAGAREFQETIVSALSERDAVEVGRALSERGFRLTRGGRFHGVTGRSDKGEAIRILAQYYRRAFGDIRLVGIGDSFNDRAMLEAVDHPVLVQTGPATWESLDIPGVERVEGVGPAGWNNFVTGYFGADTGRAAGARSQRR